MHPRSDVVIHDVPVPAARPKVTITFKVVPRPCVLCGALLAEHPQVDAGDCIYFTCGGTEALDRMVYVVHVRLKPKVAPR